MLLKQGTLKGGKAQRVSFAMNLYLFIPTSQAGVSVAEKEGVLREKGCLTSFLAALGKMRWQRAHCEDSTYNIRDKVTVPTAQKFISTCYTLHNML